MNTTEEKHSSSKRIKSAYRKYTEARPASKPMGLKTYAKSSECIIPDDAKAWFAGKKQAVLCQQRQRINTPKKDKKKKK